MITRRKEDILRIIVGEYITNCIPVSSEAIAQKGIGVSPATIRNEMTELEEGGYLTQPHTSAGRIPSEQGYRYYINSLMHEASLSPEEECLIRHQFHQVEGELEQWTRLAAAILSGTLHSIAIVTIPKATRSRLKHLELVSLQEHLALLVLILWEAKLKQQLFSPEKAVSQEELSAVAQRLTSAYAGLTSAQMAARPLELSPLEEQVVKAVIQLMRAEENEQYEEPYVEGLHYILSQPEFSSSSKTAAITEVFEQRRLLRAFLPRVTTGDGVRVVIGSDNPWDAIRHCSVIITKYGVPGKVIGAVGVAGPTRMRYDRAIPTVRFLSTLMSELVSELYG